MTDDWHGVLDRLHASEHRIALVAAGGGCKQVGESFAAPGASQTFVEAAIPYSHGAMQTYLGGQVLDSHASAAAARALAVRAFELAARHEDQENCTGISVVAALPTSRPRRGQDRVHVVSHNTRQTRQWSLALFKDAVDRTQAEFYADLLLRHAMTCLVIDAGEDPAFGSNGTLSYDAADAIVHAGQQLDQPKVVFPGSFNPVHQGHREMARIVSQRWQLPVTAELSIENVDKPSLDHLTIRDRMKEAKVIGDVRLTKTPRFSQKAALFPGCLFVIGADTAVRLDDVKYYGHDLRHRDEALDSIAMHGCRFIVFGRRDGNRFCDSHTLQLSAKLNAMCEFVPESVFRCDVSSSEIRKQL